MPKQQSRGADKETRLANTADFSLEVREDEGGGKMVIEGYAAVFDSETLIGTEDWGFYEKIARGAFDGADMKDVCLRYNHSDAFTILARTRNKSLILTPDEKGLRVRAELLDTQAGRDMFRMVQSGLIDKMSFAFTVKDEDVKRGKVPHRTITKFDRIFDVSVVDTPAYDDTSIYARSLERAEAWHEAPEGAKETREARQLAVMKLRNEILSKFGGID